ncbi:hypothetical protein D0T90_08085 [Neisseria animalis]|uniref:Uncharacterized protein n=1 Tax=Neisseria animalis TaxID=492 RepID=A0A5P3MTQ1_NEIAN|nr:hypothetical protein D0T90_08085 [Neisseria animalis]ROW31909.1 hypothetical protein CGZ60_07840 [Neisseria animalis]
MPCRTMCTVCGFAALSHSYFIRLYQKKAVCKTDGGGRVVAYNMIQRCRALFKEKARPSCCSSKFAALYGLSVSVAALLLGFMLRYPTIKSASCRFADGIFRFSGNQSRFCSSSLPKK